MLSGLNGGFNGLFHYFIYWDMLISAWMLEIQRPWLEKSMLVITYMGFPLTYIILTTLVSTYLLRGTKSRPLVTEAVFLNSCLFSTWAGMGYLKHLFERSRPVGEALTIASGFSFPSGHAMVSIAFYGFIAYLVISYKKDKWGCLGATALCLLVFMIGFSRIYLNVHYASDVLAGFLFGLICLAVNIKGLNMTRQSLREKK
ncbi:MAG: phosphatase PAP2 family protein [Syntrophomonas sp.]|nr:phosphatase PAP2 family protein [Syntrophomonas sp.]